MLSFSMKMLRFSVKMLTFLVSFWIVLTVQVLPELLSEDNIRGNTPLDAITRHFGSNMSSFVEVERIGDRAIGFNLITDGEPNDKHEFERELRYWFCRFCKFWIFPIAFLWFSQIPSTSAKQHFLSKTSLKCCFSGFTKMQLIFIEINVN